MIVRHISASGHTMTEDEVKACPCDNAVFFYNGEGKPYLIQHSLPSKVEEVKSWPHRLKARFFRR